MRPVYTERVPSIYQACAKHVVSSLLVLAVVERCPLAEAMAVLDAPELGLDALLVQEQAVACGAEAPGLRLGVKGRQRLNVHGVRLGRQGDYRELQGPRGGLARTGGSLGVLGRVRGGAGACGGLPAPRLGVGEAGAF